MPTEGGTNTPSPLDPHKPVPRRRLRDRQLRERRVHPDTTITSSTSSSTLPP
ncbi:hypothetical protein NKH18_27535 [Streptomyces sp. M10(2022)]